MSDDVGRGPLHWLIVHPVAANLFMIMLVVGGVLQFGSLRQSVFPDIELDSVIVRVVYRGASPDEVVEGVILPLEEAIRGIDGVDEVTGSAREGTAFVTADISLGADRDAVLRDIKNAVDAITSFPEDIERPVVSLPVDRNQTITLVMYGDVDRRTLRVLMDRFRNELLVSEDISLLQESGLPPPEISVEVPLAASRQYGLTLPEIARIIGLASVDVPAGEIESSSGETLFRVEEERDRGTEYEDIVLRSGADGGKLRLGDVATVIDGFRDTDEWAVYDGLPAVNLRIFRVGDQRPSQVAAATLKVIERLRPTWPESVNVRILRDETIDFRDRIRLMVENGLLGLVLVIGVLSLFLHPRLAFWVALGIPITFFGAIALMPALNVSINQISLFGFILTLGIVVDDAIVIGESTFNERAKGLRPISAAIRGTRVMTTPVVFAVTTTILAFMPMLFIPGPAGDMFTNIPLVVIPILVMSLFECLVILPAHLGHIPGGAENRAEGRFAGVLRAQQRFARGFESFTQTRVRAFLDWVVRERYLTVAISFAALLVALGIIAGGFLRFEFIPVVEQNFVSVSAELPFGSSEQETRKVLRAIEADARAVAHELADAEGVSVDDVFVGVYLETGTSQAPTGAGASLQVTPTGGHLGFLQVFLTEVEGRVVSAQRFSEALRERVGPRPDLKRLAFIYNQGPAVGPAIALSLSHSDEATLQTAARELADRMSEFVGVYDINDGYGRGKPQLDLRLTDEARSLGLTESDLGAQVRAAFFGAEAVRQQRDRYELRVYVRRPEAERASMHHFDNMIIRTPQGGEIPLHQAAHITRGESFTSIDRRDGQRTLLVTADVDAALATASTITAALQGEVLDELRARYPGLRMRIDGVQEITGDALDALIKGFLLALMGIYALLALAFRSFIQPALIMIAIPFGLIGALLGHGLLGLTLSIVSLFGVVALAGVVINDSLVLVSTINRYWQEGRPVRDAVVDGTVRRFRPVVLTSLTTFFGLAPLMFEQSLQAAFVIPMAVSLGFGVLVVTVIVLAIIPACYVILDDVRRFTAGRRKRTPFAERA